MLDAAEFIATLAAQGVSFWTGVPDSLLSPLSAHLASTAADDEHVLAVNEGAAVAIGAGHFLATGDVPAVYLQNSGLGNLINPVLSLARPFEIPMILVVGWRGEPGQPDEPQHTAQGATMLGTLAAIGVPHVVLEREMPAATTQVTDLVSQARLLGRPVAAIVRRGSFLDTGQIGDAHPNRELQREDAIRLVLDAIETDALVISTTGKASRELFTIREETGAGHAQDLRIVGSMGHAAHVAFGVGVAQPDRPIWLLDGDGALLMHQGAMTMIGSRDLRIRHIVLNNGAHESVGGQPTPTDRLDLPTIARASGYAWTGAASTADDTATALRDIASTPTTAFLDVRIRVGGRPQLGRPSTSPADNGADIARLLSR